MTSGVDLPGATRPTSRLGFGTSALIGGRTRAESVRLLDAAFDAGITHFDTARVYGSGDAEAIVGQWARAHAEAVTIATKFGIDPMANTASTQLVKRIVRAGTRRSTRLRTLVRRRSGAAVNRGRFTGDDARRSLATSFEQLAVDRVDLFLLHDCTAQEWSRSDVHEALDELQTGGRIGAFGPATTRDDACAITAATGVQPAVIQFGHDTAQDVLLPPATTITYGPFRHLDAIAVALADTTLRGRWQARLDVDLSSRSSIAGLLLLEALDANPTGIVLFSSESSARIEENASVLDRPRMDEEQAQALRELAREVVAATVGPRSR